MTVIPVASKQEGFLVLEGSEDKPIAYIVKSEVAALCVKTATVTSGTSLYVVSVILNSGAIVNSLSYTDHDQALGVLDSLSKSLVQD